VNLDIKFAGNQVGSIYIEKFTVDLERRLHTGLKNAGRYMVRELKKSLKGSNPTTFFFKSPHRELRSRTGALRASINEQMSGLSVKVGPGGPAAKYGAIQEGPGDIVIPVTEKMRRFLHAKGIHLKATTTEIKYASRPWFWAVWEEHSLDVIACVNDAVMKPLR